MDPDAVRIDEIRCVTADMVATVHDVNGVTGIGQGPGVNRAGKPRADDKNVPHAALNAERGV